MDKIVNCLEWLLNNMVDNSTNHRILNYVGPSVLANKPIIEDALVLLKEREPRVMTLEEVLSATKCGARLFTECEKEFQWVRYGTALFFDQIIYRKNPSENECKIAFMFHDEGKAYVRQWHVFYKNYGKTWRCWSHKPTDAQRKETPWE